MHSYEVLLVTVAFPAVLLATRLRLIALLQPMVAILQYRLYQMVTEFLKGATSLWGGTSLHLLNGVVHLALSYADGASQGCRSPFRSPFGGAEQGP